MLGIFSLLFFFSVAIGAGVMLLTSFRGALAELHPSMGRWLGAPEELQKPELPPAQMPATAERPQPPPAEAPAPSTAAEPTPTPAPPTATATATDSGATMDAGLDGSATATAPAELVTPEAAQAQVLVRRLGPTASGVGSRLVEEGVKGGQRGFPPGRLWLRTSPSSVRVYLGERLLGTTPIRAMLLPPGTHDLRLEAGKREPRRLTVKISSGGRTHLDVRVRHLPKR